MLHEIAYLEAIGGDEHSEVRFEESFDGKARSVRADPGPIWVPDQLVHNSLPSR